MTRHASNIVVAVATLAALAIGAQLARAELIVSIGKVEGAAGTEVVVPISLKGVKEAKGVSCMSIRLTVDPHLLTFKGVDKGQALPNALVDKSVNEDDSPGKVALGFVCGSKSAESKDMARVEEDGVVMKAIFLVSEQAKVGDKAALKLDNHRVLDSLDPPLELPVRVEDGEFTVTSAGLAGLPWLWIAIGAGVALLLLLLLLVAGRRKEDKHGPAVGAAPAPPAAALPRFTPEGATTIAHTCSKCGGVIQLPIAMKGQSFQCGACGATQVANS